MIRVLLMVVGLAIVFGAIFGWKAWEGHRETIAAQAGGPQVETVSATEARAETWQPRIRAVGSLAAVNGVEIAPEISGKIHEVPFESGDTVKAGDVLFRLSSVPERAEVQELEAATRLAEIEYDRQRRLRDRNAVSQANLDTAKSRLDQAKARAEAARGRLAMKTLRAPFDGRTGIIQVDIGEFVDSGQSLVIVQALDPIYLDFSVPQQRLADLAIGQDVVVTVDAVPGIEFPGVVQVISPRIEQNTRNVSVRARLANEDERLRPGMFVSASVRLDARADVTTVPQTAISFSPYGETVFIVREAVDADDNSYQIAEQRFVRTGARRGDQIAVSEGIEPGEIVVTSGQIKLRDGIRVEIDNSVEPDADPYPEVGNI